MSKRALRIWGDEFESAVYLIDSEPEDCTRYQYIVYKNGRDEYIFAPTKSTFNFPGRLNYWDIKGIRTVLECSGIAQELNCNPHTVFECIRTLKQIRLKEETQDGQTKETI
jgi:hypothetical protein